jgi:hypothetical protein
MKVREVKAVFLFFTGWITYQLFIFKELWVYELRFQIFTLWTIDAL